MFNRKYIKHLEKEIEHLRSQVDDLQKQLIAMSGKGHEYKVLTKEAQKPHVIGLPEILTKIDQEPAKTPEERKAKILGKARAEALLGGFAARRAD